MLKSVILIAAIVVGSASGRIASSPPALGGSAGCESGGLSSGAAAGRSLAAMHRDRLVLVGPAGERRVVRPPSSEGVLRHPAIGPGGRTAFVNDVAGSDVLQVMQGTSSTSIRGRGELTHPAWSPSGRLAWAVDLSAIELWEPSSGARRTVPPPRGAAGVFSPVFTEASRMVAVVQEPAGDTHDDGLNNLWQYDLGSRVWTKLTRFQAGDDRWTVLRTPVPVPGGRVYVVRVTGRASATELPSFELWTYGEDGASKVRDLPGEMYLAGLMDGRLVWNVPDRSGDWSLLVEEDGQLRSLGCGAVSVDPVTEADPDLLPAAPKDQSPEEESQPTAGGLVLVVGDFELESEARAVAAELRPHGALVVDHRAAPAAVRPGVWAVALPIPAGSAPEQALAELRAGTPELADRTWIAPFAVPEARP